MKASDLRAIANRDQTSGVEEISPGIGALRRREGIDKEGLFLLGLCRACFLSASGNMLRALEDPEVRQARLTEGAGAQGEQVRVIERQQAEVEAAGQAKEDAKLERLESCTKIQNFAYPASKDEVRAHLKAPSTASFPWTPVVSQHIGDCKFQVLAYVDAQNGFGANLRSNYVATLAYDPAADRWRVTSVKLEN